MARVTGYTKDVAGNLLQSATCNLFKDNLDGTCSFIQQVISDSITAAYDFTEAPDTLPQYFVVAWKDDTPHVFDCTDHVLQPRAETGAFFSVGTATYLAVGAGAGTTGSGDISMIGDASVLFIGQGNALIFMDGTGDMQEVGASTIVGAYSSTGTGDAQLAVQATVSGDASIAGTGDEQMRGQGNAPISITGTGDLQMVGGGTGTELASDPFAGLLDPLSANWTNVSGPSFTQVGGQATTSADSGDNESRYTGITWPNDQYSKCVLGVTGSTGGLGAGYGVYCRLTDSGGAVTGYRLVANNSGWELLRFNSDASTSIASSSGTTFDDGDELWLQLVGAVWTVKKNGTTVSGGSGTDGSPVSSGYAGIAYSSTTDAADGIASWAGGST